VPDNLFKFILPGTMNINRVPETARNSYYLRKRDFVGKTPPMPERLQQMNFSLNFVIYLIPSGYVKHLENETSDSHFRSFDMLLLRCLFLCPPLVHLRWRSL
jgi:hypothetical protein